MLRQIGFAAVSLVLLAGARAQVTSASAAPHQVFGAPVVTTVGVASDVDFGDFDEDGRADLLATTPTGLWRAYGTGDGSFGAPFAYAGTAGLQRTEVADLDGDGYADVASGAAGAAGHTDIFVGDGSGGLGVPDSYPFVSFSLFDTFEIQAGDADSDGDVDLAACAAPDEFVGLDGGYLALLVNDGSGVFTPQEMDPGGLFDQCRVQPADLNGDAWGDLLMSGWTGIGEIATHRPLLGQAAGGFSAGTDIAGASVIAFVTELNGDGKTDLALAGTLGFGTWLGQGDGTFVNVEVHPLGFGIGSAPSGFAAHDLDGDGLLDLVVFRDPVHDAYVFKGTGDGKTVEATAFSLAPGPTVAFTSDTHLVDFDGDGRVDFGSAVSLQGPGSGQPQVVTVLDVTYPAGGPVTDFGGKIRGIGGWPVLLVSGSFVPDTTATFALSMAKPAAKAFLVAGLQTAFMPFKGNVLVPQMDSVIGPLPVGPLGKLGLTFDWPAGMPVGQTVDVQFWIKDLGGIKSFAVSSDAHIVQP